VKSVLLMLFALLFSCTSPAPFKRTDGKLSIVQGVTGPREVEFSVLAPQNRSLRFELRNPDGEIIRPEEMKTIDRSFSPYVVHKLLFLRDVSKDYNLFIFEGDALVDQRLIGKGQLDKSRLRAAVASCMNDHEKQHFGIWATLAARAPEHLFLIGDNVYTDRKGETGDIPTTPEIIWRRYVETRLTLPVFFQDKLIPIHALWDDHDYGVNDGDSSFEHRRASQEVFEAFWAQDLSTEIWTKGPGVAGLLSLGDFNLYFLDGRSFRSPQASGKHLGLDQEAWLLGKLKEESNPSLLVKGDQFFGGYHDKDSFEGRHPKDFSHFVAELRKLKTPFNFISGDRHLSEIMQFPRSLFGTPSFEITSSPIHAIVQGKEDVENPWRVVAETDHVNFTMIDNLAQDDHWFMAVENIGKDGSVFYKRELAVFIKDLQYNLDEIRKRRQIRRRSPRRR
jgi:alkaline phosphatase D